MSFFYMDTPYYEVNNYDRLAFYLKWGWKTKYRKLPVNEKRRIWIIWCEDDTRFGVSSTELLIERTTEFFKLEYQKYQFTKQFNELIK